MSGPILLTQKQGVVLMNFSINLGAWNSIFAVPSALVDQHIKLAGAVQLKVLLWTLRHAGEPFTPQDISAALNINAADIQDAMQYWIETGLVSESSEGDRVRLSPSAPVSISAAIYAQAPESIPQQIPELIANPIPAQVSEAPEPKPHIPHRIPKPDGLFVATRINNDQEISFLMQEAQQLLGRPISPGLSSTLLFVHDDYGLPVDVIIMLLQYVKGRGKDNTNYIETVAKNWSEEGILSHEKAEEKLRRLDEANKAWTMVEKEIGISHRSPSPREEQYACRWLMEWKFSVKMVRAAYERCVDAINKLSLSYMNRILERWLREGITTPQQAALEKSAKISAAPTGKATYDLEEYERDSLDIPDFQKED